jgi:hypothetical protein
MRGALPLSSVLAVCRFTHIPYRGDTICIYRL